MSSANRNPMALLVTLGCKVNQCDTEALAEGLRAAGWDVRFDDDPAEPAPDAIVVNSCAVTARAEAKSRQAVRKLIRRYPLSRVVLAGCYPQIAPQAAGTIEGLAGVAGVDRGRTLTMLQDLVSASGYEPGEARPGAGGAPLGISRCFETLPAGLRPGRVRAFLKVQEGCPGRCTYCVVPLARGEPRSRPPDDALAQAARLIAKGARELVLTGIQLGLYGRDLGGIDLADLIRRCLRLPGLLRLRLSSLEPGDVSPRVLEALASSPKACPHLHLPLQSGSDTVLRRMGRPYGTAGFRAAAEAARRAIPGMALSTDVIAGFPGESGQEFQQTVGFLRRMGFTRLHVFPFSRRPGTPAACLPGQLPAEVKKERSGALIAVGRELALAYHRELVGREVEVLVERDLPPHRRADGDDGAAAGRFLGVGLTRHYVRAEIGAERRLGRGELVAARVAAADAHGVSCRPTVAGGP